ncbi:hypothetical protein EG856_00655 [Mycoplasmopsis phocirhinis]|uniref:Spermidine/putrescine ABC transporter substrate-binding protein n=1 Tax=Mycoplasmopsis phocirhinis TaxID=142650 RepID=A0A4V0ZAE7_9BACT|nr:hypothetical protein [Mycoplasmopsis phocirhinis]QBF34442.1 hypothetical protein EG856_00655 [Mycoplasmopsis phocirhinis]
MKTKTKFVLKRVALGVGLTITATALTSALIYKFKKPFKPTFYNYKSYISPNSRSIISEKFDFKEFETIGEFTKALLTEKAIGGIGSDAQSVQLIKRNKLKRIDYVKLFYKNTPQWAQGKTFEQYRKLDEYKKMQREIYTKLVWDHLSYYDEVLKTDLNDQPWEDDEPKHLYDYFIPYFSQDMVIAYNPTKLDTELKNASIDTVEKRKKLYELDSKVLNQLANHGFNANKTKDQKDVMFVDVLQSLKQNNYTRWELTDSVRDNMIYGSGYQNAIQTGEASTKQEPKLYERLIDQFAALIKDGIGYNLTSSNLQLSGNGLLLLSNLIDLNSNVQAGIIYNGDAYDAYDSLDNFQNVQPGTIRFIRPKQNLLLIDGLVITNSDKVNDKFYDEMLDNVKRSFMSGLQFDENEVRTWENVNDETIESYTAYENFTEVAYTPVFKVLYDYVIENDFNVEEYETLDDDENTKILKSKEKLEQDQYEAQYSKQLLEIKDAYDIVDPLTGETLLSYKVNHTAIVPTDQKTDTNLTTYWNKKTRN